MTTSAEFIDQVIANALNVANEYTNKVDDAAQDLIRAQGGAFINLPSTDPGFSVDSMEPEIPSAANTGLSFEAYLAHIESMLSRQLRDFFAQYYPLVDDSFNSANTWLINTITTGGRKLNVDFDIEAFQDFTTNDGTDTTLNVDVSGARMGGGIAIPVATGMTRGSLVSADGLGEVDTTIDNAEIDAIVTVIDVSTESDVAMLTNSGVGLSPEVAEQEWQRARERVIADGRRAEGQLAAGCAARGYTMVPGYMLRKMDESRTVQLLANGVTATEIAAKQVAFGLEVARLEKEIIERRVSFQLEASKLDADIKEKEIGFKIDIARIKASADIAWKQVGYNITLATKKADLEIEVARLDLDRQKLNADIESKEISFNIEIAAKQVEFDIERAKLGTGTARIELERKTKQIEFDTDIAEKNSKFKIEKENLKMERVKLEAEKARIEAEVFKIENEMITFAIESALKSRAMAMASAGDYIKVMTVAPDTAVKVAALGTDVQAKMMSAAGDFYRARLGRDELVLKSKLAGMDASLDLYKTRKNNATDAARVDVQALAAAADAFARTAASALSSLNSIVSSATNAFS
jgi:hypothetical protein